MLISLNLSCTHAVFLDSNNYFTGFPRIAYSLRIFFDKLNSITAGVYKLNEVGLRIGSCLACVYRVMDARGKFGEHERSVRVVRGDS